MRISFYYEGKRCRPMVKADDGTPLRPNKGNLAYARRLAEEVKIKIAAGEFVMAEYFPETGAGGPTTVDKALTGWLAAQRVESSTKAGYEAAANFWRTASYHDTDLQLPFGLVPARQAKLSHILTALARRPELSGKTVNNYTSVLRGAFALLVADKVLTANPVDEVPSAKWQKEPPDPFTPQERDLIIGRADAKHPGQIANLVRFWMWTGLRTGELIGLRWANVDLAGGTVLIREALVRKERKSTKTNVVRLVRLNSQALAALTAQKAATYLKGEEVFQDPRRGQAWETEASFRKVFWGPLLKGLGLRYRRPYQCRHTYATAMLMAGMNPAFCAKQLGHDVKVFLTTYAKWIDGDASDREMALLEQAMSPALGTKLGTKPRIAKDSRGTP